MIECFKTSVEEDESGERVSLTSRVAGPCPGCWVSVVAPTKRERAWMQNEMGVIPDFVASALDDEESSRIERDDETRQVLVIVDCPFVEDQSEAESTSIVQYDTPPLAVLFLPEKDLVMTVSLKENWTVSALESGRVRDINTTQRTRFLLQILLHISKRYQIDLRSVNRQFRENERELRRSMRNEELIKMLGFEKSLVYFSTSLKALDTTIQRISYGRILKLYDEDRDLLNDTSIEVKQAIEMCEIYTQVYNETMETFGSIINNNLNLTMRTLAIITLVLSVPTTVFSFYGMNTGLPMDETWVFPVILSLGLSIFATFWILKSRVVR